MAEQVEVEFNREGIKDMVKKDTKVFKTHPNIMEMTLEYPLDDVGKVCTKMTENTFVSGKVRFTVKRKDME